jgi:hypothetical protein
VVSKLKRLSDERPQADIAAMIHRGLVPHHALLDRASARAVDVFSRRRPSGRPAQVRRHTSTASSATCSASTETDIELPGLDLTTRR